MKEAISDPLSAISLKLKADGGKLAAESYSRRNRRYAIARHEE
jgi:hypothetical protein